MRVKNGEEFAIGGLVNEQETTENSKVPILGDLPGIGSFFRKKRHDVNKTELVVFITPRIVGENGVRSSEFKVREENEIGNRKSEIESQESMISDNVAIVSDVKPASNPDIVSAVSDIAPGSLLHRAFLFAPIRVHSWFELATRNLQLATSSGDFQWIEK